MSDEPIPESEIEEERQPEDSEAMQEILDEALERFDSVATPQIEIRAKALEARRFVSIPGAQWEGWDQLWPEDAPKPEVDKITKSLEKIETDYRENRLTVDYIPVGSDGDDETADTLDGMHRADSHDFKAQQARDNAFMEGIRGGFGAWRLTTDYADPYDRESDAQRVNPGFVIVDADQSVYFDGNSRLYDGSDAMWAFIVTADTRLAAERKWGKDRCDWPTINRRWSFDWFRPDLVYTAEYYMKVDVDDVLITLTQETSGEEQRYFESEIDASELADLRAAGWKRKSKKIKRCRVRKYILNGGYVLRDCGYIAGANIPIVPFYGRRDFVDGQVRFRGHVTKMMDRQRIYNTRVAKLIERDAVSPGEKPIFDPSQIDANMAEDWARSHVDRKPFLFAHALRGPNGEIVTAGPIGVVKEVDVPPVTALLLQAASADLTEDDDTADEVKANTSADAMDIAASRVDAKSGIYLDNMRQSIEREAEIYLGMAREVYYEPGRKVATLSIDGVDSEATLSEPFMGNDKVYRLRNNIAQGKYKVVASVQESTATKRQKTVKQDMELSSIAVQAQDMQLARIALMHAVMNMDGEGTQELQAYARNQLISLGVTKPTPEEAQQIAEAQAQNDNQPDPAQVALQAQAEQLMSQAQLNAAKAESEKAKGIQTLADAELKQAQAAAVGGPVSEPEKPSGLEAPEAARMEAETDLKRAQAEKLRSENGERRIRMGHEMEMDRRDRDFAERQSRSEA